MGIHACMLSNFSSVQPCATLWTVTRKAPLSIGFTRQEYWNGLPCLPPGDLLDPGIKRASLLSPALRGGFFTISATWKPLVGCIFPFSSLPLLLFFPQLLVKLCQRTTLPSCISFALRRFWSPLPVQCYEPLSIVLQSLCLLVLIP